MSAPSAAFNAVTSITKISATVLGIVGSGGEDTVVTIFSGPTDGGTTPGSWANSFAWGTIPAATSVDTVGQAMTGLLPETFTYWQIRAVNSSGTAWMVDTRFFSTLGTFNPTFHKSSKFFNRVASATGIQKWATGLRKTVYPVRFGPSLICNHYDCDVCTLTFTHTKGPTGAGTWAGGWSSPGRTSYNPAGLNFGSSPVGAENVPSFSGGTPLDIWVMKRGAWDVATTINVDASIVTGTYLFTVQAFSQRVNSQASTVYSGNLAAGSQTVNFTTLLPITGFWRLTFKAFVSLSAGAAPNGTVLVDFASTATRQL